MTSLLQPRFCLFDFRNFSVLAAFARVFSHGSKFLPGSLYSSKLEVTDGNGEFCELLSIKG